MDNKIVDNDTVNTLVNKLKYTRLLAGFGLATMILGIILPYIKYTTILGTLKISLWESWKGKIVLVLLIANAIFLFKDYIEKYIPSLANVPVWKKISELKYQYAMVPSLIAAVFVILITMNLDISFGLYNIGFYIFWLGLICIVIYLIINKGKTVMPNKSYVKQDETYDDLKNINNQANNNINQNYNNVANNNLTQNYNNGINNNINPNYNNTMNYGTNQNNNVNYNINSGYNNQNVNNTMNYNTNNINNGINYNQGSNTNINNGINYNQGNNINVNDNKINTNNNQNNNM